MSLAGAYLKVGHHGPRVLLDLFLLGGTLGGEDGGHCRLDEGVGADDQLRQLHEAFPDLRESAVAVVDQDPPHAPPRDEELLGDAAHGEHGYLGGQRRDGVELVTLERDVAVDLVCDDRHLVLLRDGQNRLEVLLAVHAAARVGGVVDEDRLGAVVDLRRHLLAVGLPAVLGLQRVEAALDAVRLGERLVEGEPGAR